MSKIFISYKRRDKDLVFPIVREIFENTGVDCWIDLDGIESGDQFQNVIIDAIDNADIVVCMLSKNFIAPYKDEKTGNIDLRKQTFPQKEVMYALEEGKRLIPLSIDGTSVRDCKWLKFNCIGLDCIDWKKQEQREKFFRNVRHWTGGQVTAETNSSIKSTHSVQNFNSNNGHEFVDLGLSVKWATCNVGAEKPEDYGDYFAWGETRPKSFYSWTNLKYRTDGDSDDNVKFSKYVASSQYGLIDSRTVLELSDDAARANWGGSWRMPTEAEFQELIDKCTWTWTTLNGKDGYKVVSKSNGNSIFLPAAGWRYHMSLGDAGDYGRYWTSSLNEFFSSRARDFGFCSGSHGASGSYRCSGRSVRPVLH